MSIEQKDIFQRVDRIEKILGDDPSGYGWWLILKADLAALRERVEALENDWRNHLDYVPAPVREERPMCIERQQYGNCSDGCQGSNPEPYGQSPAPRKEERVHGSDCVDDCYGCSCWCHRPEAQREKDCGVPTNRIPVSEPIRPCKLPQGHDGLHDPAPKAQGEKEVPNGDRMEHRWLSLTDEWSGWQPCNAMNRKWEEGCGIWCPDLKRVEHRFVLPEGSAAKEGK